MAMRCTSCHTEFRWTDVPLACPCRGFHTRFRPFRGVLPFAVWCQHMPAGFRVSRANRAAFYAQNYSVAAVAVTLASPVLAVAAVVWVPRVVIRPLRREYLRWTRMRTDRARNRARQQWLKSMMSINQENELRQRVRCRFNEVPHAFVAGWCQNCGFLSAAQVAS